MIKFFSFSAALLVLPLAIVGCGHSSGKRVPASINHAVVASVPSEHWRIPGKPTIADTPVRPSKVLKFSTLYAQNCSGCHGVNGQHGAAINIGNPEYQALVDDATLRSTISNGLPGTLMPAFAQSAGGMLTDAQVNALVQGMRKHWATPAKFVGVSLPSYHAAAPGDANRGATVYDNDCSECHGEKGDPDIGVGSITGPDFLTLVSDQTLRTIAIIGRTDFGMPDWRDRIHGQPMSEQDLDDVVAWLASQRPAPPALLVPSPKQTRTNPTAHSGETR